MDLRSNGLMPRGTPSPDARRCLRVATTAMRELSRSASEGYPVITLNKALIFECGLPALRHLSCGVDHVAFSLTQCQICSIRAFRTTSYVKCSI